jgi:tetratricopeptide (TPR) repeat protein
MQVAVVFIAVYPGEIILRDDGPGASFADLPMESGTIKLLNMLHERVRKLCDAGQWDEAMHAATAAVEKARAALDDDAKSIEELSASLEVKGDFLRRYGNLEEARKAYFEALELLQGKAVYTEAMARISASVAVVYESGGNTDEAITFYERSIELFERMDPPALVDIAGLCNNLAYIHKSCGDFETAETLYLKSLEIYYDCLGPEDEETAAICNNVGALYMAVGSFEQAREMFMMALEARRKVFGEKHLETAQSYANLAVSLSHTGELKWARKNFENSLKIYEEMVKEAPMDYATVSANYVDFLREQGDEKAAAAMEKRASKRLKKAS